MAVRMALAGHLRLAISKRVCFMLHCPRFRYYELYLDGVRIGDNQLDVGWTRFARNRSYTTMNISTTLFTPGKHALGLMVGTGFCGEPASLPNNSAHRAALLSLRLYSGNQSSPIQTVVTRDGTWERGQSPLKWDSA